MKSSVSIVLLFAICCGVAGCGSIRAGGVIKGASSTTTLTGVVSNVQVLTISSMAGSLVPITVVVFQEPLGFSTITFCGNDINQFPLGTAIEVHFTPSQPCSVVLSVQVI